MKIEQNDHTNEENEIPPIVEGRKQEHEEADDNALKKPNEPCGTKDDGPRLLGFWEITIMLAAVFSSGDIMIPW